MRTGMFHKVPSLLPDPFCVGPAAAAESVIAVVPAEPTPAELLAIMADGAYPASWCERAMVMWMVVVIAAGAVVRVCVRGGRGRVLSSSGELAA